MCSTIESTRRLPAGVRMRWSLVIVARFSETRVFTRGISASVNTEMGRPPVVRSMRAMRSMRKSSVVRFSISVWACPTEVIWRM